MAARAQKILRLRINGGFFGTEQFVFTDGLSCFIGGRGTGKTTILELIRFVLGEDEGDEEVQETVASLVEKNLKGGYVELDFQTADGIIYQIRRAEDRTVIIRDAQGNVSDIPLSAFRADVFSQNQIERIADDRKKQLALIDSFRQTEIDAVQRDIIATADAIRANLDQIWEQRQIHASLQNDVALIAGIENKLRELGAGHGEDAEAKERELAYSLKALRAEELDYLETLTERIAEADQQTTELANIFNCGLHALPEACGQGPNSAILSNISTSIASISSECTRDLTAISNRLAALSSNAVQVRTKLVKRHNEQELAYQQVIARDKQEQAKSTERVGLEARLKAMREKKAEQDKLTRQLLELEKTRMALIAKFSEYRDRRHEIRAEIAVKMNDCLNPDIKVSVIQNNDVDAFGRVLLRLIRDSQCGVQAGVLRQNSLRR